MSATESLAGAVCTDAIASSLELFRGFPYMVTRLSPSLYHFIVLPADIETPALYEFARGQQSANRLKSCLVLSENVCIYFDDGGASLSDSPPRGGHILLDRLRPAVYFGDSGELALRKAMLVKIAGRQARAGGYLMGDLTKGGRAASAEDRVRLAGFQPDGSPVGLLPCRSCGMWCGECLDPSSQFQGQVMTVSCLCENHNRCAACGGLLYRYRLNGNYYDASDRQIWHVPGFCALGHRCQ